MDWYYLGAITWQCPPRHPPSSTLSYIAVPAIKLDFHSSRTGKVGGGASDKAASSSRGKRAEAS